MKNEHVEQLKHAAKWFHRAHRQRRFQERLLKRETLLAQKFPAYAYTQRDWIRQEFTRTAHTFETLSGFSYQL